MKRTPARAQEPVQPVLPPRPPQAADGPVAPGDIRIARLEQGNRLVLVLGAEDGHVCLVALASNEFERATDQDVLVRNDEAALPYDILIETDVNGPILPDRLGPALGRIDIRLTELLQRAALEGVFDPTLDARRGIPLRNLEAARGRWKVDEGQLLDENLVSPAQGDVPVLVDPAVFAQTTQASHGCMEAAMMDILEGRARLGPRGFVALLACAREQAAVLPWMLDAARAITGVAIAGQAVQADPRGWKGPGRRSPVFPIESLMADALEINAWHADVLTVRAAWAKPVPRLPVEVTAGDQRASLHLVECSEAFHG
jgi:hypothetical protein